VSAKQEKLNRAELRRVMKGMLPKYRYAFAMEIRKKKAWMIAFLVQSALLLSLILFEVFK
jgi:hypothetical protein